MSLTDQHRKSILDGLNEAQTYAVTQGKGPMLVIAGAGTGKTRTLVHRVAHLVEQGVDANSILLLTFTRAAASEMLTRARELNPACADVQGGTFHSVAHRLLRTYGESIELPRSFTIIDPADVQQIIKGVVAELGVKQKGDRKFPRNRTIADLISKSRNLELSLEETLFRHAEQLAGYLDRLERVAKAFTQAKRDQALVDYDDLLFLTEELLKTQPHVRKELGHRWRYILVDEYQDTNAVQARLLEWLTTEHQNVMVVGDDAQSIYAFRGARVENILEFPKRFINTKVVKLERNYRSTQPILDLTNEVISRAEEGFAKNLYTEKTGGVRPELLRPREQKAQSRQVMERIRELLDQGVRPKEIAVIFRAGRDSFDLESALRAERLPFVKYGGINFVALSHVKDVMAHLRVLANPLDFLSWQRLLMLLPKVGPKTAQQIIAYLVDLNSPEEYGPKLASLPQATKYPGLKTLSELFVSLARPNAEPIRLMEEVLEYYEPICVDAYEDYPRRLKDLKELPGLASQSSTLWEFLADTVLDPPAGEPGEVPADPLTLSTAHSAKGKEWPHLFVIWASEGRFPAFAAMDDPQAVEEERRLMYVACTRAAKSLTIFSPQEQYFEGTGFRRLDVSRFLDDLPPEMLKKPQKGPIFPVPEPSSPESRGSMSQARPYKVGAKVSHQAFGQGKVMGYKGNDKILVHFGSHGLKTLMLRLANLSSV